MASDGKSAAGVLGVPLCVRSHCILLFRKLVGNTWSERLLGIHTVHLIWQLSDRSLWDRPSHCSCLPAQSPGERLLCFRLTRESSTLMYVILFFTPLYRLTFTGLLFKFLVPQPVHSAIKPCGLKKIFSLTQDRFFCFHFSVPLEDWNFIWFQTFCWCHSLWSPYLMTLHRLLIQWSHVIFTCTHITCHALVGLLTDLHVSCLRQLIHPSLPPYWLSWLCEDNIGPTVRVSMDEPAPETSECYSWLC